MKRKKLPSLRRLQQRADQAFSKWVRTRQVGPGATFDGRCCSCVTCGSVGVPRVMNAGHFWKRQHLGTRYDPRNTHVQCVRCNLWRGGAQAEYAAYILKTYGPEVFDELEMLHRKVIKPTREWYEEIIEKYSV